MCKRCWALQKGRRTIENRPKWVKADDTLGSGRSASRTMRLQMEKWEVQMANPFGQFAIGGFPVIVAGRIEKNASHGLRALA